MEWFADPNAWVGLVTLILLEIVLGIDNLVFIAILAEKLPHHERHKARVFGLAGALITRLGLLFFISWIVQLDHSIFSIGSLDITARGLIMIVGGAFLLVKATMELHERLEGNDLTPNANRAKALFWQVIAQIVVLDVIFSLDSVITAVGMVKYIEVMIIAMLVAVALMLWASKPLINFISGHPTVVILCLGFLMMIGFNLILHGVGFDIPEGYLYFAIGFSVLVELFNQIGQWNRGRDITVQNLRARTASTVLRMLGGQDSDGKLHESVDVIAQHMATQNVFQPEEKKMIKGVLELADRPIRSIMSPRNEVEWLDLDESFEKNEEEIYEFHHSRIILAREKVDEFVGVALTKDLLLSLANKKEINWQEVLKQPLVVHEYTSVLRVMEQLRRAPIQLAIVVDEHGSFEGIVTPIDLLEAIAGDFPEDEEELSFIEERDGSYFVEGAADIRWLSATINYDLVDDDEHYSTLAGYVLWQLGHLPVGGEVFEADGLEFEVLEVERRNITKVKITLLNKDEE